MVALHAGAVTGFFCPSRNDILEAPSYIFLPLKELRSVSHWWGIMSYKKQVSPNITGQPFLTSLSACLFP